MYAFLITVHVIVCILLISIVLIQSGRGGGFLESFSSAESIFGTKSNAFLAKTTTSLAIIFFATCLSLYFISAKRGRSLMDQVPAAIKQLQEGMAESQPKNTVDSSVSQEANKELGVVPSAKEGEEINVEVQPAAK
ncbi:MAG: preprotein translocase subunit SecG [Candidatus Omnitrophica bacterium CG11_big_fil_rev_8_21_14_0_20_42_13]|uniref:Protein-export membrane protein SecG n=1 Tax=Candidatus Ghiorseimicrobium undicola TaxID=1974746 RepID=A0A2H0LVJ4_9BACT|nr:MAG: preprotein translocase subunit SecG [Candidatus Omnitrophica bacterium CG11_big_fil_rev_8_21_14_0_20_42_13]